MTAPIRLTKPTIAVLDVLMAATDDNPAWGLSICQDADLGSGTVYPILDRLLRVGWVESCEETGPHPGRPARRYYELTGNGRAAAQAALSARRNRMRMWAPVQGGAQP
ncbi:PadR family transcriptional regulator [Streptomyces sp. NBC_01190]|uniref:PadR family transcriptional regulator n=1 Tax=Streptomyces sp. NBC_01190 TaxID=2903767 RepID=UPI00386DBA71|nr:PadR family transcriptional regulator [Streptomyces sp. NBC_01190]